MPVRLLEGKPIAERIKEQLKKEISSLGVVPVLSSIQVGEDASSIAYVKAQAKAAESLGIEYRLIKLLESTSQEELTSVINNLNSDKEVNGLIVQMPLPKQIDNKTISFSINPLKDVEGMHPENLGRILLGMPKIIPCTAAAVVELLEESSVRLYGREVVIVGHSEIVGKPLCLLLLNKFATTTVCHIATSEAGKLIEHTRGADILIVAVGKPNVVKGDWIKEGAIVIDVGINKVNDKIAGDVEFEKASQKASYITPVPGGVGPLTTTILMRNLVEAVKLQITNHK
jgi:methylenetetrahydrofolate dehydrogenase (NADP+)/methenyltetrahydrofolate cyclohydrolase